MNFKTSRKVNAELDRKRGVFQMSLTFRGEQAEWLWRAMDETGMTKTEIGREALTLWAAAYTTKEE